MSEPVWLRSAALAATLAGVSPEEAARGFRDEAAAVIRERMRMLALAGDPSAIGWVVTRERAEMARVDVDDTKRTQRGARLLACWFRGLKPEERARHVRAFDGGTLRLIQGETAATAALKVDAASLGAFVARTIEALGHAPSALEVGGVMDAIDGDDRGVSSVLVSLARSARVMGRDWRMLVSTVSTS